MTDRETDDHDRRGAHDRGHDPYAYDGRDGGRDGGEGYAHHTPSDGGRGAGWQPVARTGDDADATAFVTLPEGLALGYGLPGGTGGYGTGTYGGQQPAGTEPLEAPGHGFVPPQIPAPYAPPPAGGPGATGMWTIPPHMADEERPPRPVPAPQPVRPPAVPEGAPEPEARDVRRPDPHAVAPGEDPYSSDASPADVYRAADPYPERTPGFPPAEAYAGGAPVDARPDDSQDVPLPDAAAQWGRTPPATLPGGATAPWVTAPQPPAAPWSPDAAPAAVPPQGADWAASDAPATVAEPRDDASAAADGPPGPDEGAPEHAPVPAARREADAAG
ncbi:hypothetical protein ACFWEG_27730, partial [Streptomyces sp. NPDC060194]